MTVYCLCWVKWLLKKCKEVAKSLAGVSQVVERVRLKPFSVDTVNLGFDRPDIESVEKTVQEKAVGSH